MKKSNTRRLDYILNLSIKNKTSSQYRKLLTKKESPLTLFFVRTQKF